MTLRPFGCRVTAIGLHISTYGTQKVRRGQVFQGAREEEGWRITVASSSPGDNKPVVQMRLYKHTSKSLSDHILQQSQNSHHLHKLFRLSKGDNISTSCFQDNLKGLIRSWGKGIDQYTNFQSSLCPEYLSAPLGSVGDLVISSSVLLFLTSKWLGYFFFKLAY